MTKFEMVLAIAAKSGVDQQNVRRIVQMTLDGIIGVIVAEKRLELRDFGIFEVRMRKARKARNPKTGAVVFLPSRPRVCFKAGKIMNEKANGVRNIAPPASAPNLP